MHARSVLHRDLKPANILLRRPRAPSATNCLEYWQPVICDFGNAKTLHGATPREHASQWRRRGGFASTASAGGQQASAMTRNVTTLWYAAPEMLVPTIPYSYPIDVWALGLILAEMENRSPVCSLPLSAAPWEQLLQYCFFYKSASHRRDYPFAVKAKSMLLRWTSADVLDKSAPPRRTGRVHGARFAAFVSRCLSFDPADRASAPLLHEFCAAAPEVENGGQTCGP